MLISFDNISLDALHAHHGSVHLHCDARSWVACGLMVVMLHLNPLGATRWLKFHLAGWSASDKEHATSSWLHQVEPLTVCTREDHDAEVAGCRA